MVAYAVVRTAVQRAEKTVAQLAELKAVGSVRMMGSEMAAQ